MTYVFYYFIGAWITSIFTMILIMKYNRKYGDKKYSSGETLVGLILLTIFWPFSLPFTIGRLIVGYK